MPNQQLIDYVKEQLKRGASQEEIKKALLANGWQEQAIGEAFDASAKASIPVPQGQSGAPEASTQSKTRTTTMPPSLPGATMLLSEAWSIYTERLGVFLGITALSTVGSFGLFLVAGIIWSMATFISPMLLILAIAMTMLGVLFSVWGQAALLRAVTDSGGEISIVGSYRKGWYKIFSLLWVGFLYGLLIAGGTVLFVVPGVLFFVWFGVGTFVLFSEDVRGMNALLKSREYVRGNWWGVFSRVIFAGLLYLLIAFALSFVFVFVATPDAAKTSVNALLGLFVTPLITLYSFLIYKHLRYMKRDVAFVATGGRKALFLIPVVAGILLVPLVLSSIILASFNIAREKAHDALIRNAQQNGTATSSTMLYPLKNNTNAIDTITLPNGEDVLFVSDTLPEDGKAVNEGNCTIPEIQTVSASLRYKNTEIPLGKIGIPKTIDHVWPPITTNPVDAGLINEDRTFRWSPLQHYGINIIGVIDYGTLKQAAALSPAVGGAKDANANADKVCALKVNVKFFRLDPQLKNIKSDTYDPEEILTNPFAAPGPSEPGRMYPDNCSPTHCG